MTTRKDYTTEFFNLPCYIRKKLLPSDIDFKITVIMDLDEVSSQNTPIYTNDNLLSFKSSVLNNN